MQLLLSLFLFSKGTTNTNIYVLAVLFFLSRRCKHPIGRWRCRRQGWGGQGGEGVEKDCGRRGMMTLTESPPSRSLKAHARSWIMALVSELRDLGGRSWWWNWSPLGSAWSWSAAPSKISTSLHLQSGSGKAGSKPWDLVKEIALHFAKVWKSLFIHIYYIICSIWFFVWNIGKFLLLLHLTNVVVDLMVVLGHESSLFEVAHCHNFPSAAKPNLIHCAKIAKPSTTRPPLYNVDPWACLIDGHAFW